MRVRTDVLTNSEYIHVYMWDIYEALNIEAVVKGTAAIYKEDSCHDNITKRSAKHHG